MGAPTDQPIRTLGDAEVAAFFDRGYVVLRGLFNAEELEAVRQAFDRLETRAARLAANVGANSHDPAFVVDGGSQFVLSADPTRRGEASIQRVVGCGAAEPELARLGAHPGLLATAAQLLESSEMDQLINQAHFKKPGDGVCFPWHQDSSHRRYGTAAWRDLNGRGSYVQTALAVDDMTADNGPLRFLPGSCVLGHLDLPRDGELTPELDPAAAVSPLLRAGDVVAFGPYTVHGSLPNRSERPRRAFINGFAYPGANRREYPGTGAGRRVRAPLPDIL